MAGASDSYHEPFESLTEETRDHHRAIVSLMEELEAVDWYQQRIDATSDGSLKRILEHNRDEEKEHAAMVLEWIRRRDRKMDAELREYLFTDGDIASMEEDEPDGDDTGSALAGGSVSSGSLGIGSLRKEMTR